MVIGEATRVSAADRDAVAIELLTSIKGEKGSGSSPHSVRYTVESGGRNQ
jgi:hypothetical protein